VTGSGFRLDSSSAGWVVQVPTTVAWGVAGPRRRAGWQHSGRDNLKDDKWGNHYYEKRYLLKIKAYRGYL